VLYVNELCDFITLLELAFEESQIQKTSALGKRGS